ncbi:MAG: IS30 family transposase, partial [Bacteroidales bacterium]|nr:IS30 family transposase [Bacteroidales bacterium]
GLEFTAHKIIAKKPDTTVYFADSYASWQKGAIENANKLIRQYIPKGTDFRTLSEQYIKNIQYKLNERPRKKLNFSNPKTEFFNLLL